MKQLSMKARYVRPMLDVLVNYDASVLCASLDDVTEEQFDFDWGNN